MEEINRKRSRKSKLVPRECLDSDDENIADMEREIKETLAKMSVLEKLKRKPATSNPATSNQFSVKVEVEELKEESPMEVVPSEKPVPPIEMVTVEASIKRLRAKKPKKQAPPKSLQLVVTPTLEPPKPPGILRRVSSNKQVPPSEAIPPSEPVPPTEPVPLTEPVPPEPISETETDVCSIKIQSVESLKQPEISDLVCYKIERSDVKKKFEELAMVTDKISDKIIEAYLRNSFSNIKSCDEYRGKVENGIQHALKKWRRWQMAKPLERDSPLMYKCYVCFKVWWYLYDFKMHSYYEHPNVTFDVEMNESECNLIAYENKKVLRDIMMKDDSRCWKCGKVGSHHRFSDGKRKTSYKCKGCSTNFMKCFELTEHEGHCKDYRKFFLNTGIKIKQNYQCPVCPVNHWTKGELEDHMILSHSVRDDVPIWWWMSNCALCKVRYVCPTLHVCNALPKRLPCLYCSEKFHSRKLLHTHQVATFKKCKCPVCFVWLDKQCMLVRHVLKHSEHYTMMYQCAECRGPLYDHVISFMKHFCHTHQPNELVGNSCDSFIIPKCLLEKAEQTTETVKVDPGWKLKPDAILKPWQFSKKNCIFGPKDINKLTAKPQTSKESTVSVTEDKDKSEIEVGNEIVHENIKIKQEIVFEEAANFDDTNTNDDLERDCTTANENICTMGDESNCTIGDESNCTIDDENKSTIDDDENKSNIDDENKSTIGDETKSTIDDENKSTKDDENKSTIDDENKSTKDDENKSTIDDENKSTKDDENKSTIDDENKSTKDDKNKSTIDDENKSIIGDENKSAIGDENNVNNDDANDINEINTAIMNMESASSNHEGNFQAEISIACNDVNNYNVIIKQEVENDDDDDGDGDDVEMENMDAVMKIKDEPLDEVYEEDIIVLNADGSKYEQMDTTRMLNLDSEENVDFKSDSDGTLEPVRTQKLYTCTKCKFNGTHHEMKLHKAETCIRSESRLGRKNNYYYCTKCKNGFPHIKSYLQHFGRHDLKQYECPQCHNVQENMTYMIVHVNTHIKSNFLGLRTISDTSDGSKNGLYECKLCMVGLRQEDFFDHWEGHLDLTERTDRDDDDFRDPVIKQILELLQKSEPYSRNSAGKKIRKCIMCSKEFDRRNDFKRHFIEHLLMDALNAKQNNGCLKCQICGTGFQKAERYKRHMRDHASLPVYKCERCNKTFSDSSNFSKHKKVHNLSVLVCDVCGKKFQAKKYLVQHLEMHATFQPMPCDTCSRYFYSESSLKRHKKVAHARSKFPCPICRIYFSKLRDKWDHMWEVHKDRKVEADCPICHMSFRKISSVKQHMKLFHDYDQVYKISKPYRRRSRGAVETPQAMPLPMQSEPLPIPSEPLLETLSVPPPEVKIEYDEHNIYIDEV